MACEGLYVLPYFLSFSLTVPGWDQLSQNVGLLDSSVATGVIGGTPPTIDRHGHRIRANPRIFWGKGGGVCPSRRQFIAHGTELCCLLYFSVCFLKYTIRRTYSEICVRQSRFCTKILSKLFVVRGSGLDPAGELTALPRPPSWWGEDPLHCSSPRTPPHIGSSGHVIGVPPTSKSWLRHCYWTVDTQFILQDMRPPKQFGSESYDYKIWNTMQQCL